jgi:hypothetical protein
MHPDEKFLNPVIKVWDYFDNSAPLSRRLVIRCNQFPDKVSKNKKTREEKGENDVFKPTYVFIKKNW